MDMGESMDTGDLPAEQTLPSHSNPEVGVLFWLPLPSKKTLPHLFYCHRSRSQGQSSEMGKLRVPGEDPKRSYIQGQGTDRPALPARRASL